MIDQLKKELSKETYSMKRMMALVVFGAIALVFVLFGIQGKHTAMGVGSAARVNSTLISVAEFRDESHRMEQMYSQFFGGQMNADAQRQFISGQALENLITAELVSQGAREQGILITDAEVRDFVVNEMPVFRRDGVFQKDLYFQILEGNRLTAADFEEKIRKEINNQRTRRIFELTVSPLRLEVAKLKSLKEIKVNVDFAKIDEKSIVENMVIPASEIQGKLADQTFMKKIEADFNLYKSSYNSEEQVKASHILVKVDPANPESDKQALEKIQQIKKRSASEDFGKLASELSDDPGSKKNKGDLGFFTKGRMVPEFDEAAFTQAVGVVGAPVKSSFGYHLIKVTDKKAAVVASLDNTKNAIAKKIFAEEKFGQLLKDTEDALAKSDLAQVDGKLKQLGVSWEETGFVDMNTEQVPKLGSPVATQALFSVSAKKPLLNKLVRDGQLKFVLKFKASKVEPSADQQSVFAQLTKERSTELFGSWIDQMKKSSTIERNPVVVRGE